MHPLSLDQAQRSKYQVSTIAKDNQGFITTKIDPTTFPGSILDCLNTTNDQQLTMRLSTDNFEYQYEYLLKGRFIHLYN